jgi:osmotically-inducible protein OsmY
MNKLKRNIKHGLVTNWSTDNQKIQVNVTGHRVKLNGTVDSPYQKDEAERIAWYASEVWSAVNELVVDLKNQQTAEVQYQ